MTGLVIYSSERTHMKNSVCMSVAGGALICLSGMMNASYKIINDADNYVIKSISVSNPRKKIENENGVIISRYKRLISRITNKPYKIEYLDNYSDRKHVSYISSP